MRDVLATWSHLLAPTLAEAAVAHYPLEMIPDSCKELYETLATSSDDEEIPKEGYESKTDVSHKAEAATAVTVATILCT